MTDAGARGEMHYRTLDPRLIIETAERLQERVAARFPDPACARSRPNWCRSSRDLAERRARLAQPIWWLRILIGAAIVAGAAMFIFVGTILSFDRFSGGDVSRIRAGHRSLASTRCCLPASGCWR